MTINRKERGILKEYSDKLKTMVNPDSGVRENLLNMYMDRYPDVTENEAEEIIDNILKGISDFDQGLSAYTQNGLEAVLEKIEQDQEEKSPAERYAAYCNMTLAIKTMDQRVLSSLLGPDKFQADNALEELFGTGVDCETIVTVEMVEEAREQMISALESSVISLNDIERLKNLPEDSAEEYIREFAVEGWSLEERKAYLSLAAYLAYQDGKLLPEEEEEADPYLWAVAVAASVETEKTIHDALKGNIAWEAAAFTLKAIGCVALTIGVCALTIYSLLLYLAILFTTSSLIGTLLVGTIGLYILCFFCDAVVDTIGLYWKGFDHVKAFVENNYGVVLEGIQKAYEFIKSRVTAGYLYVKNAVNNSISNRSHVTV
ncbi:hypothetical protein GPL15_23300 [Clostridium sp. MCC353]|uniref:hypothetical protein n=1 Tax=Clostridium sp. MCC353 TaxID=2592646 RepID=UPI001C03645D|nr:hypothetical protein [Clostridium sp. MCC353]MBT9779408.1 hypothetical protein [Clostridium sp. MCC353]